MSSHFDTIHVKLSTHAYFALLFHSMLSEYENSKNKFYDVITSVLYCQHIHENEVTSVRFIVSTVLVLNKSICLK